MLENIHRTYLKTASVIPNWQTANKNDLLNNCVKYREDPVLYNAYVAAVILRYWGNIGKYYNASKASGFTIEDCYEWLIRAVLYTIEKHKWLDTDNKLYNDPAGPDKVLNRVIYSTRQLAYYNANLDKRKANYGKVSLDEIREKAGDRAENITKETETFDNVDRLDFNMLLEHYASKGEILKVLVLHSIYHDFPFNAKQKKQAVTYKFKPSAVVNILREYASGEQNLLSQMYHIPQQELDNTLKRIVANKPEKSAKVIKAVIKSLAADRRMQEFVCC